jgi:hypothetical protein
MIYFQICCTMSRVAELLSDEYRNKTDSVVMTRYLSGRDLHSHNIGLCLLQEMSGLCYFMLDQSRKDAEYCMENAFTTYLVIIYVC